MNKPLVHSYSAIKEFQNCARKYHAVRILKQFKQQDTQATLYGTAVHKAFEEFIANGAPLPEAFEQYRAFVEPLTKVPGDVYCEKKLGVRADFSPCDFFASDVWFRGIPDYLVVNHETSVARVGDFKTGKSSRYADPGQLELMAAMVMAHFPTITKVKGALLFVVAKDVITSEYTRDQLPVIWSCWGGHANAIEKARERDVWNASPSGLCKFCPLSEAACEHR